MKICVYGAGAIGGYLGAKLALAGAQVTLIARGPHLAAMKEKGLTLITGGDTFVCHPFCTADPAEAGPQDYVIMTLKAHSVPPAIDAMRPLFGPETAAVTAMNGVPWWYFQGFEGPWRDRRLNTLDPDGRLTAAIPITRVIGCVVYPAAEIVEPGVVKHIEGDRFMLGEPDGSRSPRVAKLSEALTRVGVKSPVRPRIRDDIWLKLWGNLSFNPLSALTQATLVRIATDPGTRAIVRAMMVEAEVVARKLGVKFPVDVDTRIKWAAEVGEHKTSMLQDLERGRPMEIDALLGGVVEMARLVEIPTPAMDIVLALVRQRAQIAGAYPA
ncbi:MAG: 2-dehydropantoate 2-reductase [Rhodospirillaceae bacterium]|nr:2-dehydropantoate 2-reductase [Rhodospirillaceae bacterium]